VIRIASLGIPMAMALTACGPAPKSPSYFSAHPTEAARVVSRCRTGAHRGDECENAKAALGTLRADDRLKLYRETF
jgi:hypothetical protein